MCCFCEAVLSRCCPRKCALMIRPGALGSGPLLRVVCAGRSALDVDRRQVSSGVRQREPPHPGSHLCYSSPVPIRCPCAGLEAGAVGQHAVPAPPAPCGTRSTEAAEGGSGGAGYAVAMTALIAATSATTRVRRISFFTPSPFHVLLVLSAPGTYLRMRPREGRPLGTHGDVHLLPISLDGTGSFNLPSGSSPAPT